MKGCASTLTGLWLVEKKFKENSRVVGVLCRADASRKARRPLMTVAVDEFQLFVSERRGIVCILYSSDSDSM